MINNPKCKLSLEAEFKSYQKILPPAGHSTGHTEDGKNIMIQSNSKQITKKMLRNGSTL